MKNYKGGNFTWYECEAHAYLKVPLAITFAVNIQGKIDRRFSPQVKQHLYLEEDCAAPMFLKAFKEHYGEPAEYDTQYKSAQWADKLFEMEESYFNPAMYDDC